MNAKVTIKLNLSSYLFKNANINNGLFATTNGTMALLITSISVKNKLQKKTCHIHVVPRAENLNLEF